MVIPVLQVKTVPRIRPVFVQNLWPNTEAREQCVNNYLQTCILCFGTAGVCVFMCLSIGQSITFQKSLRWVKWEPFWKCANVSVQFPTAQHCWGHTAAVARWRGRSLLPPRTPPGTVYLKQRKFNVIKTSFVSRMSKLELRTLSSLTVSICVHLPEDFVCALLRCGFIFWHFHHRGNHLVNGLKPPPDINKSWFWCLQRFSIQSDLFWDILPINNWKNTSWLFLL